MAIKTTKSEINQIIKEEFQRLMEKKKLKSRIQQINEELATMEEEDQSLEEVEASGNDTVRSHAWTGEKDGDEKFKPKFEKKGSHLLEDEDEEEILDIEDAGAEVETEKEISLSDEFAELGAAIESKIKAVMAGTSSEDENSEEFEEVEVEDEETEEDEEVEEDEETEDETEDVEATAKVMAESKISKKQIIKEVKKTGYLNLLSEGLDKDKKSALKSEVERMRRLAKLDNNE